MVKLQTPTGSTDLGILLKGADSLRYYDKAGKKDFRRFAGDFGFYSPNAQARAADSIMQRLGISSEAYTTIRPQKDLLIRDRETSFALFCRDFYLLELMVGNATKISVYDLLRQRVHGEIETTKTPLHKDELEKVRLEDRFDESVKIYQNVSEFMRKDEPPESIKAVGKDGYGFHLKGKGGRDLFLHTDYSKLGPFDLQNFSKVFDEIEDHAVNNGYFSEEAFKIMLFVSKHRRLVNAAGKTI